MQKTHDKIYEEFYKTQQPKKGGKAKTKAQLILIIVFQFILNLFMVFLLHIQIIL